MCAIRQAAQCLCSLHLADADTICKELQGNVGYNSPVDVSATSQERRQEGLTLDQGLSIHKAEAIDLVLLSPVMKGVQDEVSHHCMATVEHSIVAVVGGCIQASQGRGLGLFVGALTGEAVLHLSQKQQQVPSVSRHSRIGVCSVACGTAATLTATWRFVVNSCISGKGHTGIDMAVQPMYSKCMVKV